MPLAEAALPAVTITGPAPGSSELCESILRALPNWFGIEEALLEYVRDVADLPTFTAHRNGEAIGLLSIKQHFEHSAEIHLIAVRPEHHRSSAGRALVDAAERWLLEHTATRFLQVKTLSSSREDASYAATRRFYSALGFVPLEEFPTLWGPRNPCLLLIKTLDGGR